MSSDAWAGVAEFLHDYRVPLLILVVVLAITANTLLLTALIRRTASRLIRRADPEESGDARIRSARERFVRRTRTASTVAVNLTVWVQAAIAVVVVLGILGVDLTAVLASAGVLAAVLTFGAQNVITDLISGLFLVFEDQLDVGDQVDTGLGIGTVEAVGIRVTRVRDLTGTLWSIRNGEITRVGNGTRDWRRIVLDLTFAPATDAERAASAVVSGIAAALADRHARTPPECAGVIGFDGSGVTLRYTVEVPAVDAYRSEIAVRTAAREAILADPGLSLASPLRIADAR